MGKITNLLIILIMLVFFFTPVTSFAVGLGIQIPAYGSGDAHYKVEYTYRDYYGYDEDISSEHDMDISHFGIGFVLDTKVANPGVFNYRLNINYENVNLGNEDQWKDGFNSFSIDNTFGFAVLQSSVVRLWIGPQIRLAYMHFSHDDYNVSVNIFGIAFGPVLGANFNLGSVVSLCPELGYRLSFYGGSFDFDEEMSDNYNDGTWTMDNKEFFLRFNILFRISDNYDNFF